MVTRAAATCQAQDRGGKEEWVAEAQPLGCLEGCSYTGGKGFKQSVPESQHTCTTEETVRMRPMVLTGARLTRQDTTMSASDSRNSSGLVRARPPEGNKGQVRGRATAS